MLDYAEYLNLIVNKLRLAAFARSNVALIERSGSDNYSKEYVDAVNEYSIKHQMNEFYKKILASQKAIQNNPLGKLCLDFFDVKKTSTKVGKKSGKTYGTMLVDHVKKEKIGVHISGAEQFSNKEKKETRSKRLMVVTCSSYDAPEEQEQLSKEDNDEIDLLKSNTEVRFQREWLEMNLYTVKMGQNIKSLNKKVDEYVPDEDAQYLPTKRAAMMSCSSILHGVYAKRSLKGSHYNELLYPTMNSNSDNLYDDDIDINIQKFYKGPFFLNLEARFTKIIERCEAFNKIDNFKIGRETVKNTNMVSLIIAIMLDGKGYSAVQAKAIFGTILGHTGKNFTYNGQEYPVFKIARLKNQKDMNRLQELFKLFDDCIDLEEIKKNDQQKKYDKGKRDIIKELDKMDKQFLNNSDKDSKLGVVKHVGKLAGSLSEKISKDVNSTLKNEYKAELERQKQKYNKMVLKYEQEKIEMREKHQKKIEKMTKIHKEDKGKIINKYEDKFKQQDFLHKKEMNSQKDFYENCYVSP
ncbi:MAG: hypothetical protein GY821_04440 [Gammaproteobacteria bacterium]|nr:hypothetical protein [Gammaproteobacteria bacterium]